MTTQEMDDQGNPVVDELRQDEVNAAFAAAHDGERARDAAGKFVEAGESAALTDDDYAADPREAFVPAGQAEPEQDPEPEADPDPAADPEPEPVLAADPEPTLEPADPLINVDLGDGVVRTIPASQASQALQQSLAAQQQLIDRNTALEEHVRKTDEQRAQGGGELTAEQQAAADAEIETIYQNLWTGDKDDLKAAVALIRGNPGGAAPEAPRIDVAALTQEIVEQAAPLLKLRQDEDAAFQAFSDEYPDIIADPNLSSIARDKSLELIRSGVVMKKAVLDAGEFVAKRYMPGRVASAPHNRAAETFEQRQQRVQRETRQNPGSATGGARVAADPPPQTHQSVIVEEAQRRGQIQ